MQTDPEREKIREELNRYRTVVNFLYRAKNWSAGRIYKLIFGSSYNKQKVAEEIHKQTGGKKDGDKIRRASGLKYKK